MKLPFGFSLTRQSQASLPQVISSPYLDAPVSVKLDIPSIEKAAVNASGLSSPDGSWHRIWGGESYVGQWQQHVSVDTETVLTFSAVFACIRLIAHDIGKLRIKLVQDSGDGIWQEIQSASFSPVLRKPNAHQIRIKFIEQWMQSKLTYGRTYVLKGRDARGVVTQLWVLDPLLVDPLVSDETGAVYYRCYPDPLAGLGDEIIVPAREIIHDVYMTFDHPLLGVSPIGACGLAATQGLKIQQNSAKFFQNQSRAGVVLTAPGTIKSETAERIKAAWEANFGGENYGRTAVLGDGLEPKAFTISAEDAQLIQQLDWTALDVCRAFGVPPYKIGVGPAPALANVEALEQSYYSHSLQEPIECIEALLDEGLALPTNYGTEFDLDGLMRMDSMTMAQVLATEIRAGYLAPNEARKRRGLKPVEGGDSPMSQQQNYSLAALAKRDAQADPFAPQGGAAPPPGQPPAQPPPDPKDEVERFFRDLAARLGEAA